MIFSARFAHNADSCDSGICFRNGSTCCWNTAVERWNVIPEKSRLPENNIRLFLPHRTPDLMTRRNRSGFPSTFIIRRKWSKTAVRMLSKPPVLPIRQEHQPDTGYEVEIKRVNAKINPSSGRPLCAIPDAEFEFGCMAYNSHIFLDSMIKIHQFTHAVFRPDIRFWPSEHGGGI